MESMVNRLLEQELAVRIVLSSDKKSGHLVPTWQVLESLSKALSPVAELTHFLSGDKHVTISSVLPVLHNHAKVLIEEDDDTQLTKFIKKKVVDSMNTHNSKVKELLGGCNIS